MSQNKAVDLRSMALAENVHQVMNAHYFCIQLDALQTAAQAQRFHFQTDASATYNTTYISPSQLDALARAVERARQAYLFPEDTQSLQSRINDQMASGRARIHLQELLDALQCLGIHLVDSGTLGYPVESDTEKGSSDPSVLFRIPHGDKRAFGHAVSQHSRSTHNAGGWRRVATVPLITSVLTALMFTAVGAVWPEAPSARPLVQHRDVPSVFYTPIKESADGTAAGEMPILQPHISDSRVERENILPRLLEETGAVVD